MEMVAEILGSQSFAETPLGKKGRAVGSLMELSQFQLDLLWLTSFGKRWNVLQCERKANVTHCQQLLHVARWLLCLFKHNKSATHPRGCESENIHGG